MLASAVSHLPPRDERAKQHLPDRRSPDFASDARIREFIATWTIKSTEKNVPKRKERREVLVQMLALKRVVDAMSLWAKEQSGERSQWEPDIGVDEITPLAREHRHNAGLDRGT
jgi:hypothetical protein